MSEEEIEDQAFLDLVNHRDYKVVILYGTQSGTSEKFAQRFNKHLELTYSIKSSVFNLEKFSEAHHTATETDHVISRLSDDKIYVFFISSYGDGEQCDSAVEFYESLKKSAARPKARGIRYCMFGVGSSLYELYQGAAKDIENELIRLNCKILGKFGEADDGKGTSEEDFEDWKFDILPLIALQFGITEAKIDEYSPSFKISEVETKKFGKGEITTSLRDLMFMNKPPFHISKPFIAKLTNFKELYLPSGDDRKCLHVEVDLNGSNLSYQTGDHLGIYTSNNSNSVERCLKVFGLKDKHDKILNIVPVDRMSTQLWFPNPINLKALFQYYLEINGAVTRQTVQEIIRFAPSNETKEQLAMITKDKDVFKLQVTNKLLSLHELLINISKQDQVWSDVPISFLLESFGKLYPRYYSISSSNLSEPKFAHLVVSIESDLSSDFEGVCSNHLLDIKEQTNKYDANGPNDNYKGGKAPIFIEKSKFRLPLNSGKPIIMIGAGTGVAPFRGFLRHRVSQFKKSGIESDRFGKMILFYGCRNEVEFLYKSEWEEYRQILGDKFQMEVSYSRELKIDKEYVQDRVTNNGGLVYDLIVNKGAYIYVCGNASRMAKGISKALIDLFAEKEGDLKKGDRLLKSLRITGRYQEDVW